MWRYGCPRSPDWDSERDCENVDGADVGRAVLVGGSSLGTCTRVPGA